MTDADLNNSLDTTTSETEEMTWANTFAGVNLSVSENTAMKQVQAVFDKWAGTDEDKIRQLLELTDKHKNTFLMKVVGAGMVNLATMLLGDENKNVQNDSGWTLLYQAVYNDDERMVRMLLNRNVDVNLPNNDGWTPLYQAVFKKNKRMVQMLLEKADVNIQNKKGWTALHLAVFNGDEDLVEELLNKKEINISLLNKDGQTPFSMAASNRDARIIEKLAKKMKADALQEEINRMGGSSEIQKFLKKTLGAKYKEPQKQSETVEDKKVDAEKTQEQKPAEPVKVEPVAEAKPIVEKTAKPVKPINEKSVAPIVVEPTKPVEEVIVINTKPAKPVVKTPVEKKTPQAKPSVTEPKKKQPKIGLFGKLKRKLMKYWFFSWGKINWNASDEEIAAQVKKFIEAGADVNARNDDNDTMLILAAAEGKLETVKMLLANGADPNLKGEDDDTALHQAAYNGYDDIMDALIKKGARLNEVNTYGETPLMDVIGAGKVAVACKMMDMDGIDLNLQDNSGNSALIVAIKAKQSIIAKKIANKNGVDLNLQDENGDSALMLAGLEGDKDLIEILVSRHANENLVNEKGLTVSEQLRAAGKKATLADLKSAILARDRADCLEEEHQQEMQLAAAQKLKSGITINLDDNKERGELRKAIADAQKALRRTTEKRKKTAQEIHAPRDYGDSAEARRRWGRMKKEEDRRG